MMYGLLLVSIAYIFEVSNMRNNLVVKDKLMKSAAMYAIVLNFKHIYLYSAPAFGILYVRQCLLHERLHMSQRVKNFVQLAV